MARSAPSNRKPSPIQIAVAALIGILVGTIAGVILIPRFFGPVTPATVPSAVRAGADPTNVQQVRAGSIVYLARCASCHGANLEGQPNWRQPLPSGLMPAPPHDASGHTWHHNDQSLFTTVKQGGQATSPPGYRNAMPAFGNVLSDQEIWAVLAYIKSTWPPEIQRQQQTGH